MAQSGGPGMSALAPLLARNVNMRFYPSHPSHSDEPWWWRLHASFNPPCIPAFATEFRSWSTVPAVSGWLVTALGQSEEPQPSRDGPGDGVVRL